MTKAGVKVQRGHGQIKKSHYLFEKNHIGQVMKCKVKYRRHSRDCRITFGNLVVPNSSVRVDSDDNYGMWPQRDA